MNRRIKMSKRVVIISYAYSLSQSNILLEKTENLYEFIKEAIFSPEGDLLALPVRKDVYKRQGMQMFFSSCL